MTTETAPTIDLSLLTADQLEALLSEKRKADQAANAAKRNAYERDRESLINFLGQRALVVARHIEELKEAAMGKLPAFRALMLEYGDLRRGEANKGSFEIKNEHFKIVFSSQINKRFDERAELAEERLKKFLTTTVKKRDLATYELVNSLLERNDKTGDYDIGLINRLYKLEDKFDNKDWREAIRLFKEAYNPSGTAQYARFFRKTEAGHWEAIVLDFAKIRANVPEAEEPTPAAEA